MPLKSLNNFAVTLMLLFLVFLLFFSGYLEFPSASSSIPLVTESRPTTLRPGPFNLVGAFKKWDSQVGCAQFKAKHKGSVKSGPSSPSLQESGRDTECGELKMDHVSVLVKGWTWIPDNLDNLYSCRCGLSCLWTKSPVLADKPDALFFETARPPFLRRKGDPLRVYMDLEAGRKRSGSEDIYISYHAKDDVQSTYAGALFHNNRNYHVSSIKNNDTLVYWSSSRCLDQRDQLAQRLLNLLPHHSFGKCLNNVGGQDMALSFYPECANDAQTAPKWWDHLHCAMSHYKFVLAIENTATFCIPLTMSKTKSQVITCKAAVCWEIGKEVTVEEIQVDPPKSFEVRVKVLYASLCHSDILCANGFANPVFPRVLGHEGVGVVESVGEGVTEVKEGDLVIPTFVGECRECENCLSDKTNLCLKYPLSFSGLMLDDTPRLSIRGQTLYHLSSCSTWAEYMVVNINFVAKIDPAIPLPDASFISCGFTAGFGASWKDAKIEKGTSVAVIGLGAVGLGAIEGARKQGAVKIIGIDTNGMKKEKGEAFGMTDFINPRESDKSLSEMIKEVTGGTGVDYCIECTGVTTLINEAVESTKVGKGKTILVGAANTPTVEINFLSLFAAGRTIKGSICGGIKIKSELPSLLDKCVNKEIQLDELLTHEVTLEDINKAFVLMKQPDCVKVLIKI